MITIPKKVYVQGYLNGFKIKDNVLYSHAFCPTCLKLATVKDDLLFCEFCKSLHKAQWGKNWFIQVKSEEYLIGE